MMDPVDLLGDIAAVRDADRAALLPAVATAGAQVRSTAMRVAELFERVSGFESGADLRPRAVVVLATGRAVLDAELAVALIGPRSSVPIVIGSELPAWVGALDVVVVLAGDAQAGGIGFSEATQIARRRGAAVLVRAADGGEMAYAAGPSLLVPAIGVPEALAGSGRLTVLLLIANLCGLLPRRIQPSEIEQIADLLDAESLAFSPQVDTFVNPAKGLALHLMAGAGVFIGADPVGTALAAHGAWILGEIAGRPSQSYSNEQIVQAPAIVTALAARRDPFADPFEELMDDQDGVVQVPFRSVILRGRLSDTAGGPAAWLAHSWYSSMQAALPGAITLDGPEMVLPLRDSGLSGEPGLRSDLGRSETTGGPSAGLGGRGVAGPNLIDPYSTPRVLGSLAGDWAAAALMMLRMDFAAVYLGIIAGQPIPVDAPAGLGAHAASRDLLRPDTVVVTSREQEEFDRWN